MQKLVAGLSSESLMIVPETKTRHWTSKIEPNFACFFFLKYFLGGPPPKKFWNKIIKLNTLSSNMQNFAAIGQRSSEIFWRKKRK